MPKIIWTEEEDQIIRKNFGKIPTPFITSKLKCRWLTGRLVEYRCHELGLLPRKNKYAILAEKVLRAIGYGIWTIAVVYVLVLVGTQHGIYMAFSYVLVMTWLSGLILGPR